MEIKKDILNNRWIAKYNGHTRNFNFIEDWTENEIRKIVSKSLTVQSAPGVKHG